MIYLVLIRYESRFISSRYRWICAPGTTKTSSEVKCAVTGNETVLHPHKSYKVRNWYMQLIKLLKWQCQFFFIDYWVKKTICKQVRTITFREYFVSV